MAVGGEGHYSLPKYLLTVFLVLGLRPRTWGQALRFVHYSCLTQGTLGPGRGQSEAGALGWRWGRCKESRLLWPTRLEGIWLQPKAQACSLERWGSWGREGPPGPGWEPQAVSLTPYLALPSSQVGTPPGPGGVRQASACLTSWAGGRPWRQSKGTNKNLDERRGAVRGQLPNNLNNGGFSSGRLVTPHETVL